MTDYEANTPRHKKKPLIIVFVKSCPLTKLADDDLPQLHSNDDTAVTWQKVLMNS